LPTRIGWGSRSDGVSEKFRKLGKVAQCTSVKMCLNCEIKHCGERFRRAK